VKNVIVKGCSGENVQGMRLIGLLQYLFPVGHAVGLLFLPIHTRTHAHRCIYGHVYVYIMESGPAGIKNHVYVSAASGVVGAYLIFCSVLRCSVVAAAPIIAQAIKNALFMRRNWTPSNRQATHRPPPTGIWSSLDLRCDHFQCH